MLWVLLAVHIAYQKTSVKYSLAFTEQDICQVVCMCRSLQSSIQALLYAVVLNLSYAVIGKCSYFFPADTQFQNLLSL